jgi:exoribonuclease R
MRRRKRTAEPGISKEEVLRHIRKSDGRSANLHDLLETFDATPQARRQIKDILVQLVRDGHLQQHRGNRYEAKARNLMDGTILLHRDGYGFVIPAQQIEGVGSDIFIPPSMTGSAMNGDKVQFEITLHKPGRRAEGRIVNVTKRNRDTVVGQLRFDGQTFPERFSLPATRQNTKTRSSKSRSPDFPAPLRGLLERSSTSLAF